MAIVRFREKPKVADYEGVRIGVREPSTKEMLEITKGRQLYLKSLKDDPYSTGEGDLSLFLDLQMSASRLLACDPDDATSPWFAQDSDDQKRLEKNGVLRDLAEDVPHKLHTAVWNVLTRTEGPAPLERAPEKKMEAETTSDSIPLSSESPSTLAAPSETLNSGNGVVSLTESLV